MNSRDLQTQKPKMTWRATTTARHTASAMLLLVSTFVLLLSGTANAQSSGDPSTSESTCLGFDQIVEFDLQVADRTLESGINNSTGAIGMPPKAVPAGFRVGGCVSTQQRTRLVFGSRVMSADGERCSRF